jgi:transcription elongation GreA/GreB family factor
MNLKSEAEKRAFKAELKKLCMRLLEERVAASEQAMALAQESANSDEKSSAGDKHETGRSMGQLDREMNARQAEEARRELLRIATLDETALYSHVTTGAVVVCKDFIFYVSGGLGIHEVEGRKVVLLSPAAPLAAAILRKKAGDTFLQAGKTVAILDVF